MENKLIKIVGIVPAVAKSGSNYWKISTESHGNMSCFEKSVADELAKHINEPFNCVIAESNGFQNIRAIAPQQEAEKPIEVIKMNEKVAENGSMDEKKDVVRAMSLTRLYYELISYTEKAEKEKEAILKNYKYFLNNL